MPTRNRRIWTALTIAVVGYIAAAVAGAGAAFGAMLTIGVIGEIWLWRELLRGWLTRRA